MKKVLLLILVSVLLCMSKLQAQYFSKLYNFSDTLPNGSFVSFPYTCKFINDNTIMLVGFCSKPKYHTRALYNAFIDNKGMVKAYNNYIDSGIAYWSTPTRCLSEKLNNEFFYFATQEYNFPNIYTIDQPVLFKIKPTGAIDLVKKINFNLYSKVIPSELCILNNSIWSVSYTTSETYYNHINWNGDTLLFPDWRGVRLNKYSFNGDLLFDSVYFKNYVSSSTPVVLADIVNYNNEMIITAGNFNFFSNNTGLNIIRTKLVAFDTTGNIVWEKFLGNPDLVVMNQYNQFHYTSLIVLKSGDLLVASINSEGKMNPFGPDTASILLTKLDKYGFEIWEKKYYREDTFNLNDGLNHNYPMKIIEDAQKSIYILTQKTTYSYDIYKLDSEGNVVWRREYSYYKEGYPQTYPTSFDVNSKGEPVIVGYTHYNDSLKLAGTYPMVAWLDRFGCLEPDCQLGDSMYIDVPVVQGLQGPLLQFAPNPVVHSFSISANNEYIINEPLHMDIFSIEGKLVYSKQNIQLPHTENAEHLPKGMYIAAVRSDKGVWLTKKFVKE
jgi:hypothetical protein